MKKMKLAEAIGLVFGDSKTARNSVLCKKAITEMKGVTRTGKERQGGILYEHSEGRFVATAMMNYNRSGKNNSTRMEIASHRTTKMFTKLSKDKNYD